MWIRSRLSGVYTTGGDDSLSKVFGLTSKQLHYVLVILESHNLITKQLLKSEKQRSIVYLRRFAFKNKTPLENVKDWLMRRPSLTDSLVNIKRHLSYSGKQFKTMVSNGERQKIFERVYSTEPITVKKNKKLVSKTRQGRMLRLNVDRVVQQEEDSLEQPDEDNGLVIVQDIGVEQSQSTPLYTQILSKIQMCGKDGVALKQLGVLFGLDFYKSRRLGSNLQTNPDLVTIMRETVRGKAKYQSIAFRKVLQSCSDIQTRSKFFFFLFIICCISLSSSILRINIFKMSPKSP